MSIDKRLREIVCRAYMDGQLWEKPLSQKYKNADKAISEIKKVIAEELPEPVCPILEDGEKALAFYRGQNAYRTELLSKLGVK